MGMRMKDLINEICVYKIEKWNDKKEYWEFYRHFNNYVSAKNNYKIILENEKGIFRLIKTLEINER